MEFLKPIKIPESLEKPSSKEEIDEEYLRVKKQQSKNITEQSFEDKSILFAIEELSYSWFEIKEGENLWTFGNSENQNLKISFNVSKINLNRLDNNKSLAFFDLENSIRKEGINDKLYQITNFKFELEREQIDLFDEEITIFAPIKDFDGDGKEKFKRAIWSRLNYDAKVMYSGLPLNNMLALFNLFHEIGHIIFRESLDKEDADNLSKSRRKEQNQRDISEQTDVLEDERMASAYALKKVRKLVDFFGIKQTLLSKITHLYLTSYMSDEKNI